MYKLSLVMPTYNRGENLINIINTILKCDVKEFTEVEILVVDDGSAVPAATFLSTMTLQPPFTLKVIRQENAGPAFARNNGFKQASNEIVLFMDDDILAFPDMLYKHAFGHKEYPGSVIYGYCPYTVPAKTTAAYRFLESLSHVEESTDQKSNFIPTNSVASGNISVEKKMFPDGEFYKSFLRTPAAEEFELMARLAYNKVKIYFNSSIRGWHLQPATIEDKCKQEYKYGIGVAEVALKVPYSLDHSNLQSLYYENCETRATDSFKVKLKKAIKSVVSKKWFRNALLKIVKGMEVIAPIDTILFPLYRMLAGTFVFAGVREGLKKFDNKSL
jgi:glycosyltransferase involved in cell wall biosynthesis